MRQEQWFCKQCKDAFTQKKKKLRRFQRAPTSENLAVLRRNQALARRTFCYIRESLWRYYVSTLNT